MTTENKGSKCIGGLGLPTRKYGGVTGFVFHDGAYYTRAEVREIKRQADGVTFPLTAPDKGAEGKGIEQH